tara:strand:+ start:1020 stop:1130 length:111 start_codon:yes stop_codon:yes gene_type:complete
MEKWSSVKLVLGSGVKINVTKVIKQDSCTGIIEGKA